MHRNVKGNKTARFMSLDCLSFSGCSKTPDFSTETHGEKTPRTSETFNTL